MVVAWGFEDQATPFTEAVLDLLARGSRVLVPAIWPLEVANALLGAERRQRVTVAQVTSFLSRVAGFPISVEPLQVRRAFDQILSMARQQNLTEYDAAYLELALREALPLATLDDDLRRAAQSVGIKLVSL